MNPVPGRTAFVDESMPRPRGGTPPRYVIAATMLEEAECAEARWTVAKVAGRLPRFHWKDALDHERRHAVDVVAELNALHLLVVSLPLDPQRQERARAVALERTLYELDVRGVTLAVLESRTDRLNRRDLTVVDAARRERLFRECAQVLHAYPQREPLLWIPDVVAGAFGAEELWEQSRLGGLAEVERVRLD